MPVSLERRTAGSENAAGPLGVRACMRVPASMRVHLHGCVHARMHMHMRTHARARAHVGVHGRAYANVCERACVRD